VVGDRWRRRRDRIRRVGGDVDALGVGSCRPIGLDGRHVREVSVREVQLPGGRPGVVVFAEARRCEPCLAGVRAARDALQATSARGQLIVLMTDSGTGRADVRAFARSVGPGPARYVIDDRNGGLSSMLGASSLGSAVVYDTRGRVVARPDAGSRQIVAALQMVDR